MRVDHPKPGEGVQAAGEEGVGEADLARRCVLDHAEWAYHRSHVRRDTNLTPYEKTRYVKYQKPILMPGEAVLCRRPGAMVNKLEMQWLEGIWIGREAKTDEHLVGTPQVVPLIAELREYFPQWKNEVQMVMCLHICGYNNAMIHS